MFAIPYEVRNLIRTHLISISTDSHGINYASDDNEIDQRIFRYPHDFVQKIIGLQLKTRLDNGEVASNDDIYEEMLDKDDEHHLLTAIKNNLLANTPEEYQKSSIEIVTAIRRNLINSNRDSIDELVEEEEGYLHNDYVENSYISKDID